MYTKFLIPHNPFSWKDAMFFTYNNWYIVELFKSIDARTVRNSERKLYHPRVQIQMKNTKLLFDIEVSTNNSDMKTIY